MNYNLNSNTDTYSASLLAVGLYFLYSLLISIKLFLQFPIASITLTSLLFLALLFITERIFNFREHPLLLNKICSHTFALALIAFSCSIIYSQPNTSGWAIYIKTFPIAELESGASFHQDTSYHVALINSMMNLGFPSTGQHGTPFNMYHILSHTVDALFLKISGLDPYDSYGLFHQFKIFIFISAILLLIGRTVRGLPSWAYIVSVIAIPPIIISSWHGIASHGLWLGTLVLLTAATYLYAVYNKDTVKKRDYINLFVIIAIISLSKISAGFMLATFTGILLLQKDFRKISVYIFGTCLLIFFYFYSSLFQAETSTQTSLSNININSFFAFFSLSDRLAWHVSLWHIYYPICASLVWMFISIVTKNHTYLKLSIASSISILILYLIITTQVGLNDSEQWYFTFSLGSTITIILYISIVEFISKINKAPLHFISPSSAIAFVLIASLVIIQEIPSDKKSLLTSPLRNIIQHILSSNTIESNFKPNEILSIKDLNPYTPFKSREIFNNLEDKNWIYKLQNSLNQALNESALTRRDTLMFIPRSIYDSEVASLGGPKWASGLLVYSLFGVPLAHGVESNNRTYGLSNYTAESMRKESISENEIHNLCSTKKIKGLVLVTSLMKTDYEIRYCTK